MSDEVVKGEQYSSVCHPDWVVKVLKVGDGFDGGTIPAPLEVVVITGSVSLWGLVSTTVNSPRIR